MRKTENPRVGSSILSPWAPNPSLMQSSKVRKPPFKALTLWTFAPLMSGLVQRGLLASRRFIGIFVGT